MHLNKWWVSACNDKNKLCLLFLWVRNLIRAYDQGNQKIVMMGRFMLFYLFIDWTQSELENSISFCFLIIFHNWVAFFRRWLVILVIVTLSPFDGIIRFLQCWWFLIGCSNIEKGYDFLAYFRHTFSSIFVFVSSTSGFWMDFSIKEI